MIQIVGSTKALASIAALTVERDGDIRKASLAALATAYKILGGSLSSCSAIWSRYLRLRDFESCPLTLLVNNAGQVYVTSVRS